MNAFRVTLVCVVFVLVSCQKSEKPGATETEVAAVTAAESSAPEASVSNDASSPATPPAEMAVIATGESEVPGLSAEIHSLTRGTGEILTLHFSLINGGEKEVDFGYNFTDPGFSVADFGGIGGVYLLDPAGMEKYTVMRDVDNRGICSRKIRTIAKGSRALLWAKFPAPAESVSHVSIFIPKFLPIDDVPVGPPPSAASPDMTGPKPVIASARSEIAGRRVEIHQLKRGSGDIIDLRFSIVNDGDGILGFGYDFTDPNHEVADFGGIGGVYLLDPIAREKHGVIRDTDHKCACSQKVRDLAKGERVEVFAKFPAPAPSANRLSVVVPHFLPMDDIPIQ